MSASTQSLAARASVSRIKTIINKTLQQVFRRQNNSRGMWKSHENRQHWTDLCNKWVIQWLEEVLQRLLERSRRSTFSITKLNSLAISMSQWSCNSKKTSGTAGKLTINLFILPHQRTYIQDWKCSLFFVFSIEIIQSNNWEAEERFGSHWESKSVCPRSWCQTWKNPWNSRGQQ